METWAEVHQALVAVRSELSRIRMVAPNDPRVAAAVVKTLVHGQIAGLSILMDEVERARYATEKNAKAK